MRDGWVETNLDGIAEYINGYPFKPTDLGENGLPVIRIKQLLDPDETVDRTETETPERCLLRNGDIVFSWSGTLAVRIWNRGPAKLNQHLFRVVEKEGVYKGIIPLILDHAIKELEEKSHGTTMKHITKQTLLPHKVLLPPLPEQKRIVNLISSVDSYIEALQQQFKSAKKSRNAVLHELLTAGSDDWVETTLGEITDLVRGPFGGSLKKEIFVQEGFAVYEQQHAIYGDFSTIRYRITSEKFDEMKRFSLVPGDLIMSCSGTMGKVRIVPKEADPGIINQALLKIKPKSNLSSDFLYLWMQSDDFIRQIEMNSGGGALQNVSSVKMLKGIKLRVPILLEQERIIEIISMFDEVIIKSELAICETKNLRSGLLPDLLSGAHEIPASYEKVMGAA
jgi:type I restriction enzyme S subunit